MYELIQAGEKSWYIDCPAKMGIYVPDGRTAWLIDSGNDKSAGKKALRIVEEQGWTLRAILNTHAHADHIGGNRFLQERTGCKIFAPGMEACIARYPLFDPLLVYGGRPGKELRHKFLLAQESLPSPTDDEAFPGEVEVLPLPGHALDMVGYRLPDGVVFLADSVVSPETLEKYGPTFLMDPGAHLETLERIAAMEAVCFVPSHASACGDIRPLAAVNRQSVLETVEVLLEICREGQTFDAILQQVFRRWNLTMNAQQHALVGSTIRSYLSWLVDGGQLENTFDDCLCRWRRV